MYKRSKEELALFKENFFNEKKNTKPIWACGQHIDKLYNRSLKSEEDEFIISYASVDDIIRNLDFIGLNPYMLFGNGDLSDFRVMKILKLWKNETHLDPPIINSCERNDKRLAFSDGRHRTIVAYHLAAKQIPIIIQTSDRLAIQEIIKLHGHLQKI